MRKTMESDKTVPRRRESLSVKVTRLVFAVLALFAMYLHNINFFSRHNGEAGNGSVNTRANLFTFNTGNKLRKTHQHNSHLALPVPQNPPSSPQLRASLHDPLATLTINVTKPLGGKDSDAWVSATWRNVGHPNPYDWIGVFPCMDDACSQAGFGHAPTQYKLLSKDRRTKPTGSGSVNFWIQVRPGVCAYKLVYVSGNTQFPFQIAQSPKIEFEQSVCNRPMHVRLSTIVAQNGDTSDSSSAMRVMWAQRTATCSLVPQVKWGLSTSKELTHEASAQRAFSVHQSDMCDLNTTPAGTLGWIPSGLQLSATMSGLEPGKEYNYVVGDELHGWSPIHRFRVPTIGHGSSRATHGKGMATKLVVFGDMGQSLNAKDESMQHSWDYHYRGEIHAPNTTMRTAAMVNNDDASLVLHFGDISYAVGYESEWDTFMLQIEPVASKVPWMTGIGNHEMGWSNGYYAENDSGGECGYQYIARFPFSTTGYVDIPPVSLCSDSNNEEVESRNWVKESWKDKPWYSFDHEGAHVTVMSTEHDFAPGSEQYKFLQQDMQSVDRSKTPWLVFTGHRPMYVHSDWEGDQHDSSTIINSIEPLLLDNNVDIALWGHHHSYQRTCHTKKGVCVPPGEGILHVLVGSAGYDHSAVSKKESQLFVNTNDKDWGVALLELGDDGYGKLEFKRDSDGKLLDRVDFRCKA